MSYQVGVDLGATYCAAAVRRPGRVGGPDVLPLTPAAAFLPSVVFAGQDGSLSVGEDAERAALTEPDRIARRFTRRIGDGTPLLVGGTAMPAEVLAARLITRVLDIVAEREGGPSTRVAVTHPPLWGSHRLTALRTALATHGLGGALFLSEPQAAALAQATRERINPGDTVAIYDLGGATFNATVLRRLGDGSFEIVGRPEELELGGLDFDEVVFAHVTSTLGAAWEELDVADPAVLAAVARLRRECTAAKEALSADTDVLIPVVLPGIDTSVRLGRSELEELIRPGVDETVAALLRALSAAAVAPDGLATVLLVGGSARIPLIPQTVSAQLGRAVTVAEDPKGIVAVGAALAVSRLDPDLPAARPVPEAEPTRVGVPAGLWTTPPALDPIPRSRPPLPVGPPPNAKRDGRWLGLPRVVTAAAAAIALAGAAVTGTILLNSARPKPTGADADTKVVRTSEAGIPTTDAYPPQAETTSRESTRQTAQPPRSTPRTTTGAPKATTTTTTPPNRTTSSTTTTRPTTTTTTTGGGGQ